VNNVVVFANWKMYKTVEEAKSFITGLVHDFKDTEGLVTIMCVPYPYIAALCPLCAGTQIYIAAENMYELDWGAYTGEVSAPMLKSVGCSHVLLGHSERRGYFFEKDENVNRKFRCALKHGITPIVCIGETAEEKTKGMMRDILQVQIKTCLDGVSEGSRCYVAYEPRWAIGAGITPGLDEIEETHRFLRESITTSYGKAVSQSIKILYGGSVDRENARDISSLKHIDGIGIGTCSLDYDCFSASLRDAVAALR
jgi:triosephosphate isomerase